MLAICTYWENPYVLHMELEDPCLYMLYMGKTFMVAEAGPQGPLIQYIDSTILPTGRSLLTSADEQERDEHASGASKVPGP